MATTTDYSFNLPTVGGDSDVWGGLLNANWSALDDLLSGDTPINGIDIASGTAVFSSLTAGGGATDTLTGLTLIDCPVGAESLSVTESIQEGVQTASGTSPTINPDGATNKGTIVTWALTASQNHTPAITLDATGKFVTLLISGASGATVTWAGVTWINGEPVLSESGENVVELFRVGATTYGIFAGST